MTIIQSNYNYPLTLLYDKDKTLIVETFGELAHAIGKLKAFKPTIKTLKLLPWGNYECYVIGDYSIAINTIDKELTVYYDNNNVGVVYKYFYRRNGFIKVVANKNLYNRELPIYVNDLIKEIQRKLI